MCVCVSVCVCEREREWGGVGGCRYVCVCGGGRGPAYVDDKCVYVNTVCFDVGCFWIDDERAAPKDHTLRMRSMAPSSSSSSSFTVVVVHVWVRARGSLLWLCFVLCNWLCAPVWINST